MQENKTIFSTIHFKLNNEMYCERLNLESEEIKRKFYWKSEREREKVRENEQIIE